MNDSINTPKSKAPLWFTILAVLMAIWNLLGVMAFVMQMNMSPEQIAALPAKDQAFYQDIPLWVNIAFGTAVIGGALGCIALVLKKSLALPVLSIALVAVIVQMFHAFFIANAFEVYGPGKAIMPAMVIIIAAALVWLAKSAQAKGWIS